MLALDPATRNTTKDEIASLTVSTIFNIAYAFSNDLLREPLTCISLV
jgi:hypothetical protein